ncbi:MAG: hypothetical protein LBH58_08460 [Tannerellaceae bacterium]|jgi:hypothetical protein|nr:hypothetical protein [Tannerellaceae bacterium]
MREEEYTFVTIDSEDSLFSDAVVIDIDSADNLGEVVIIDESMDSPDFITLADDTIMLSDADMDTYLSDMNDADISMMI